MKRREFITLIGGVAVTWPLPAQAQQTQQKRRIGVLMSFAESDASARAMFEGYRNALTQLGWTEGKNLQMEVRWAAGDPDKIQAFSRELVELRPDAILVQGTISTGSVVREHEASLSCLSTLPTRSAVAMSRTSRAPAVTSPDSCWISLRRVANGSNC